MHGQDCGYHFPAVTGSLNSQPKAGRSCWLSALQSPGNVALGYSESTSGPFVVCSSRICAGAALIPLCPMQDSAGHVAGIPLPGIPETYRSERNEASPFYSCKYLLLSFKQKHNKDAQSYFQCFFSVSVKTRAEATLRERKFDLKSPLSRVNEMEIRPVAGM